MGSFDQKMLIAFKCYDVDDDQCIDAKEVSTVLKNIPIHVEGRYGSSFSMSGDNQGITRTVLMSLKTEDNQEIAKLMDEIFKTYSEGMYFDEFKSLALDVTSELFMAIYDCVYQYIPCVKNFLIMRANYKKILI